MIELGLVTGYLIGWSLRKARRVGATLDQDVDEVLDAGMSRLHDAVVSKLGADPALVRLNEEVAASGHVSDRTRRRVEDAVADATEHDTAFADALDAALVQLAQADPGGNLIATGDRVAAVWGKAEIRADHGSAAALVMGDVTVGGPPDPTGPVRASG